MKERIQKHLNKYCKTDNLFELVEVLNLSMEVLESEGFPLKELSSYKLKEWILQTKNTKKYLENQEQA